MEGRYNVLFLCTGNSARSIMAEAILNFRGRANFTAYSAGSHPAGRVRPEALEELEAAGIPTTGLRSKSWEEFTRPGAPVFDFVFTVCDYAAREACPAWPGNPITVHWTVPDPAAVVGTREEVRRAFRETFIALDTRIGLLVSLPLVSLDRMERHREVERIGRP